MNAMGTSAQEFYAIRIFDQIFPDMFQVSQETQNTNVVTLISPKLPKPDSDPIPAEPREGRDVTAERLRTTFQKYAAGLRSHIEKEGGTLTISKTGKYLNAQPGFTVALRNAALGKDGATTKILEALGFRVVDVPGKMAVIRNPQ